MNSNWTTNPPTINGIITGTEWDDATVAVFNASNLWSPDFLNITVRAKNDAKNLYLCIQWIDYTYDTYYDQLGVLFDDSADGFWGNGENAVLFPITTLGWLPLDSNCERAGGLSIFYTNNDTYGTHGSTVAGWAGYVYTVEMSLPLNSSDAEDLQSTPGDLIGIALFVGFDWDGSFQYIFQYPNGTQDNWLVERLQLASGSGGIGTPSTFLYLLTTVTFIAVYTLWKKDKLSNLKVS